MPSEDNLKKFQSPDSANVSSDEEIPKSYVRNAAQLPRVERDYSISKPNCAMLGESPEQPVRDHSSAELRSASSENC